MFITGLIYSTTNHILCRVTEQEDSMINSVAAGTLTGALYKSTGRLCVCLCLIIFLHSSSWIKSCVDS